MNLENLSKEELLAYIQSTQKKPNTKLLDDLQKLFSSYSSEEDNETNKLLWLFYLLSARFSSLSIPINEELDKLSYIPEEDVLTKLVISQVKLLSKELSLRKSKKPVLVEVKTPESPL